MVSVNGVQSRGPAIVAIALALGVAFASPAAAAAGGDNLTIKCQAQAPVLGPIGTTIKQPVTVDAPGSVKSGQDFDIVITPGPTQVPANVSGIPIKQIRDGELIVPNPENSTYEGADISGGDVEGKPEITVRDGKAVVSFAGPEKGGSTFTLPTVTAHLKAGDAGKKIESKLGGTGFDNPDLTFTTTGTVLGADVDAPTTCYADPSPTLATTSID